MVGAGTPFPPVLTQLGACVGHPYPEMWWPNDTAGGADTREAVRICSECPVRLQCLTFALDSNQPGGVWGGTTDSRRRELKRRRRRTS